jgi:hypothetical protein
MFPSNRAPPSSGLKFEHEDRGDTFLQNVGKPAIKLQDVTAQTTTDGNFKAVRTSNLNFKEKIIQWWITTARE